MHQGGVLLFVEETKARRQLKMPSNISSKRQLGIVPLEKIELGVALRAFVALARAWDRRS